MFSKRILEEDVQTVKSLNSQIKNCRILLSKSIFDLIQDETLNELEIADEKEAILTLSNELVGLKNQLSTLEDQMFLNYTNTFYVRSEAPNDGKHSFPHINTITS